MTGFPELICQTHNWTVQHYVFPEGRDWFDLSAPYQRGSVWTLDQRRALIRSLVIKLPVPALIIADVEATAHYRVIDGKQRIEAVRAFFDGQFAVPRSWLRDELVKPEARDREWVFFDEMRNGFLVNRGMPAIHVTTERAWVGRDVVPSGWVDRTPEEALAYEATVYGLINSAGTVQSPRDLARAAAVAIDLDSTVTP